ncbi:single-stranded DNA-binding protein [Singulisphaera rosea]
MADLNKVYLMGRLTFDPELRYTPSGSAVTDLKMATSRTWTSKDGDRKEETLFIDVTVWDRQAENCCQYLKKGSSVHVEGSLKLDSWDDKTTGEKRTKIRVQADRVQFLDRRGDSGGGGGTPTEENSWLTYDDPQGAFHFRHPQDLRLGPQTNDDMVELLRNRSAAGPDRVVLLRQHRTGDTVADKQNRNPDFLAKTIEERWKSYDILRGPAGWLPDADWAPSKMKVYRMSLALRGAGAASKRDARIHDDNYLVLFGRDDSIVVESSTIQDPPSPFRAEVEAIIKTVQLGPITTKPSANAPRR